MSLPTLWKRNSVASRSIFDEAFGVDGIFDRMFRDFDSVMGVVPYQTADNKVMFEIECPGFNKDNLKVEVADGIATITGDREIKGDRHAGAKSIYQRVSVGEPETVDAVIKDGILYLEAIYPEKKKSEVKIRVVGDEKEVT